MGMISLGVKGLPSDYHHPYRLHVTLFRLGLPDQYETPKTYLYIAPRDIY